MAKSYLLVPIVFGVLFFAPQAKAYEATTTVTIRICGNAIVEPGEFCDDGSNFGTYSSTTSNKVCAPGCYEWGPYCGDSILQVLRSEACDDGNNLSGDGCSAACGSVETVARGGFGGGTGPYMGGSNTPSNPTQVVVQGKAYPNADVNVLKDGNLLGIVKADGKADFYFSTKLITPGTATFGFWSSDAGGLKSISFTTTLQILSNTVTTISGVYLPPTISVDKRSVKKGEAINISGQTIPQATVAVVVNSNQEINKEISSNAAGGWRLPFDTSPLEESIHTVKAQFKTNISGSAIKSTWSQAISFFVGEGVGQCAAASDLNGDNRTNLVDFSILLFNWGKSSAEADVNCDGKVNLADFSIMLFNWTG